MERGDMGGFWIHFEYIFKFLVWITGGMELPSSEMGKAAGGTGVGWISAWYVLNLDAYWKFRWRCLVEISGYKIQSLGEKTGFEKYIWEWSDDINPGTVSAELTVKIHWTVPLNKHILLCTYKQQYPVATSTFGTHILLFKYNLSLKGDR